MEQRGSEAAAQLGFGQAEHHPQVLNPHVGKTLTHLIGEFGVAQWNVFQSRVSVRVEFVGCGPIAQGGR